MVQHFSYEKPRDEAIPEIKLFLEEEGFKIVEYAPEDGFMYTDYKVFKWGQGERLLALVIHIHDKVTITGMGKMEVPAGSIGDSSAIIKIVLLDKLPYVIQKRIFLPLGKKLNDLGYIKINHWP